MRRYLIHLSYFGTRYRGFQKQNIDGKTDYDDSYTICGLLETALKGCEPLNYPKVTGSSRTDKGVHALCNTVHVDLDGKPHIINSFNIMKRLNVFFAYNDHDIRVLKVQQVAEDFHCRYKVCRRKYLYRLAIPKPGVPYHERTMIPYPISEFKRCHFLQTPNFDAEAVKAVCGLYLGEKDFGSFCSISKNADDQLRTVRELDSLELSPGRPLLSSDKFTDEYHFWDITCSSRAFMYHQVRRIVTSLLAYGQGRVTKDDLQRLFDEPGNNSCSVFNNMVPPEGLFLTDIDYKAEDLEFSEELHLQEIQQLKLQEETRQLLEKLRVSTNILEKIELRERLLEIRKLTFSK